MGLFDRISRVVKANLNDLVNKAEDPEKILEQSVTDMQEDLVQLRQAVASAIATQKRTQTQYNQAESQSNQWQQRAQLALQKGDETLAREALVRKKSHAETAATLKASLDQQSAQVESLKRNLIGLESKISEAKTKKDMLKARISAAKAQEQLNNTIGTLNTGSSMAAFDRMEEKVLQIEARAGASAELAAGSSNLEEQFRLLESGGDVDDELAQMKAQLTGGSVSQGQLPAAGKTAAASSSESSPVIDAELEELRSQLNKM
ncbi:PspA/IM30 family protein [Microcoleus sp. Pol14C2]|jgi:phage shock protein A|uniref:Phage shock protein A (PspA) family protein n=1 Tax=Phormidium nigroviride PCC 7112 TaxID=179408 RepID=K9VFS8_9CYAN|nr:PspA/IM30 family protein [Oscillatoria nigro-viridis]AFZ06958.1 phage shock protein A (PspA) family protein [Oscillatoria nigro-viridis PCC 7112]